MGAGHVNVSRATDPGLVYDLGPEQYTSYIFGLLGEQALKNFTSDPSLACSVVRSMPEAWLNLPTIMVPLRDTGGVMVPRTVTNIGPPETYHATVQGPSWIDIRVDPHILKFSKPGERKSFLVTVTMYGEGNCSVACARYRAAISPATASAWVGPYSIFTVRSACFVSSSRCEHWMPN
jgi:hypothetical protein